MPNKGTPVPRCPEFRETYQRGCRCDFCRKENTRRRTLGRLREQARERGVRFESDRLDPAEARKFILDAIDNRGLGYLEIERITGLQRAALKKLYAGTARTITRDTHDRILKTMGEGDVRAFTHRTPVQAKWTRQMVYSLCAQGWTKRHQADLLRHNLGVDAGFISTVCTGNYECVYYGNEQAMRWLVSEIGSANGPSKRSKQWAARAGHFPTKHYNVHGELIESSLNGEQRKYIEGV